MRAAKTRQVPKESWDSAMDIFGDINRGKKMTLEYFSKEEGDQHLVDDLPLFGISAESKGQKNVITITFGKDRIEYEHRIEQPKEVWAAEDEIIEIIDDKDGHAVVSLQK